MRITRMPPGAIAPADSDCIKITREDDGRFALVTSALDQCGDDEGVSEAVVGSAAYETYELAEQAGLAWAEEHCVAHVHVETA